MKIKARWNPKNKFCVARVHYSVDDEKNTPEWIEKAKEGQSERAWNQEMEISYETFAGKPVYPGFREDWHISEFEFDRTKVDYMYGGWDFGYHRPAWLCGWINQFDQLCIRNEILGEDESIKAYGERIKRFRLAQFGTVSWLEACDPAGHQKTDKAEFTSVEVLANMNITPTSKASEIDEGLEIIRQRLVRRNDGKVGLLIHPDCKRLIDAFKGGYRYPEVKEGTPEKEKPMKDNFYDNIADSLRYLVLNFLELAPTHKVHTESPAENSIMGSSGDSINDLF